jgi:hypothetical protein
MDVVFVSYPNIPCFLRIFSKMSSSMDNSADTTDLENQIDQLVYKLYDLTEEEIKIIGNA